MAFLQEDAVSSSIKHLTPSNFFHKRETALLQKVTKENCTFWPQLSESGLFKGKLDAVAELRAQGMPKE